MGTGWICRQVYSDQIDISGNRRGSREPFENNNSKSPRANYRQFSKFGRIAVDEPTWSKGRYYYNRGRKSRIRDIEFDSRVTKTEHPAACCLTAINFRSVWTICSIGSPCPRKWNRDTTDAHYVSNTNKHRLPNAYVDYRFPNAILTVGRVFPRTSRNTYLSESWRACIRNYTNDLTLKMNKFYTHTHTHVCVLTYFAGMSYRPYARI